MLFIQKKYIRQLESYYHFLQQNILKTVAENGLFYTDLVESLIVQKAYQHNYKSDHFLHQNSIKSW